MSQRFDIASYVFDGNAAYFIDANVLLYIFGPMPPNDWKARTYSNAWKRLRASRAAVFLDVLVTSEILNRWARIEHVRLGGDAKYGSFKEFRDTPEFRATASEIVLAMRTIFKTVKRTGTPFANVNIEPALNNFADGTMDFVDSLICESCRLKPFILVTHDADMRAGDVDVVTANRRLLT